MVVQGESTITIIQTGGIIGQSSLLSPNHFMCISSTPFIRRRHCRMLFWLFLKCQNSCVFFCFLSTSVLKRLYLGYFPFSFHLNSMIFAFTDILKFSCRRLSSKFKYLFLYSNTPSLKQYRQKKVPLNFHFRK